MSLEPIKELASLAVGTVIMWPVSEWGIWRAYDLVVRTFFWIFL